MGKPARRQALLLGYIGYENTGDEFLLRALCNGLARHDIPLDLTVLTRDPDATRKVHPVKTPDHPPFGGGVRPGLKTRLARLRATMACDVFIMGPGGFLQDYDRNGVRNLFGVLRTVLIARLCGARVIGVGLGAGPIVRPWGKRLVRALCALSDLLLLRDEKSIAILRDLGVHPDKMKRVGDLAFAETAPEEFSAPNDPKVLGVSVFDFSSYIQGDDTAWEPTRDAIAGALNIAITRGHNVHFIVMQGQFGGNDLREAEAIRAKLSLPDRAQILLYNPDPLKTFAQIAACDWFLGMRLHSLIMAAIARVPFAGISYHPKVATFMETQPHGNRRCLPLKSLTAAALKDLVEDLLTGQAPADTLAAQREAAEKNFVYLTEYCERQRVRFCD